MCVADGLADGGRDRGVEAQDLGGEGLEVGEASDGGSGERLICVERGADLFPESV